MCMSIFADVRGRSRICIFFGLICDIALCEFLDDYLDQGFIGGVKFGLRSRHRNGKRLGIMIFGGAVAYTSPLSRTEELLYTR